MWFSPSHVHFVISLHNISCPYACLLCMAAGHVICQQRKRGRRREDKASSCLAVWLLSLPEVSQTGGVRHSGEARPFFNFSTLICGSSVLKGPTYLTAKFGENLEEVVGFSQIPNGQWYPWSTRHIKAGSNKYSEINGWIRARISHYSLWLGHFPTEIRSPSCTLRSEAN